MSVDVLRMTLKNMALELNSDKCRNIAFNPIILKGGKFRRYPQTTPVTTRARLGRPWRRAAQFVTEKLDFDTFGVEREEDGKNLQPPCPFPLTESPKVLGVIIDEFFTLDVHFRAILTKAPVRQVVLHRVATSMEVGVLKMTHDAVLVSLMRSR